MSVGAIMAHQAVSWQGPFPPPDAVERYERVTPGAFDRILGMAERAEAARIADTRQAQAYHRADIGRGHWLGFAVALAAIAAAVACAVAGYQWVAVTLVGVPVMSVGKSLVDGGRRRPIQAGELAAAPPPPPPAAGTDVSRDVS